MDFWGDFGQVSAAIGGLATVLVAAFGAKLWQVTGGLSEQTRLLAEQTRKLAEHTDEANNLVKEAAQLDRRARLRPKLDVWITAKRGATYGGLCVRHAVESETETIDSLSVEIAEELDSARNDYPGGKAADHLATPWGFSADLSTLHGGDPERGLTAPAHGPLSRGVQTYWSIRLRPTWLGETYWGSTLQDRDCLIQLTATAKGEKWSYTAILKPPGESGKTEVARLG